mgnify:CR=1 FL=1
MKIEKNFKKESNFWVLEDNGKVKIIQSKLTDFLTASGFSKTKDSGGNLILLKEKGNVVTEIDDSVIIDFVKNYLIKIEEEDILEAFSKGVSNYINSTKLKLLNTIELLNDKDGKKISRFFFKNICCQVGDNKIKGILYEDLDKKVWDKRMLKEDFNAFEVQPKSQFERFCYNLAGKDDERFLSLRTIIGYLLHRYQDPANAKAIILVDENISFDGTANGGTGKTLLLKGIEKCREIVVMDGKHDKKNSWFKNQRIEHTTDIVFYDDVTKEFSLEQLYSMITTGVVVEKKYKGEVYINPEDSPKICISSNYIVKGTGGNTDIRRRCDFEIANHYNGENTPSDEFGGRFFDDWDKPEWSSFFNYMMSCVNIYFNHGLIVSNPINLKRNGLINNTSLEFVSFMEIGIINSDKWESKKTILELFIDEYPHFKNLSSHQFTKWMKIYAKDNELEYEDRKSGVKYEFYLKSKSI